MDQKGQTSTEYILLVALGLVIVLAGISIATQIKEISDTVSTRVEADRNSLIGMFLE